ncbi:MAG: hypothetical protein HC939_22810 [Pleurocapsa sp. SU_5_0]|nr:hypothetical protein [Pleurocapsa sp. SU_5_0]NJO95464.1 hypothetical protein [Pleurocapsa sp. CRU_1_2]
MFDKLQIHSLVTSVLLLPALALIAHPSDFSFENSTNYPICEFSISSNRMENWKECKLLSV